LGWLNSSPAGSMSALPTNARHQVNDLGCPVPPSSHPLTCCSQQHPPQGRPLAVAGYTVAPAQMRVIGGRSLWLTGEGVYRAVVRKRSIFDRSGQSCLPFISAFLRQRISEWARRAERSLSNCYWRTLPSRSAAAPI
jgi:hypothetical protein